MSPCDLNSGLGQLAQAFTHLKESWLDAKIHWRDDAARGFEEKHLAPIPGKVQALINAVQRLANIVQRAEQDCRDYDEAQQL